MTLIKNSYRNTSFRFSTLSHNLFGYVGVSLELNTLYAATIHSLFYKNVHIVFQFREIMIETGALVSRSLLKLLFFSSQLLIRHLVDICLYERLERGTSFFANLIVSSTDLSSRIRIRVAVSFLNTFVTLIDIFANAGWAEREASEQFGVFFKGNKDNRNLLSDYGSEENTGRRGYSFFGKKETIYSPLNNGLTHKSLVAEVFVSKNQKNAETCSNSFDDWICA